MTFFELEVVSRYPTIECREFLEESPGVAAIEGTQTTFSPGNRSMMRSDSTMASETEVLLIPPGPIMQMREVSPRRSNCAIPSTKPSRPWKISGFMGISCRESRPLPRSLEVNRYVRISSTLWCMSYILRRRAWRSRSLMKAESRRSLKAGEMIIYFFSRPSPEQSFVRIHTVNFCVAFESRFIHFENIHIWLVVNCYHPSILSADFCLVLIDCRKNTVIS